MMVMMIMIMPLLINTWIKVYVIIIDKQGAGDKCGNIIFFARKINVMIGGEYLIDEKAETCSQGGKRPYLPVGPGPASAMIIDHKSIIIRIIMMFTTR